MMSLSRVQDAKKQFQRALEIDPGFSDARYDLASAEAANAEWESAARDFQQVIRERSGDGNAREHLGEVLMLWGDDFAQAGNFEQALPRYDQAIAFRPADPGLRMNFRIALARLNHLEDARTQFEAALRFEPGLQRERKRSLLSMHGSAKS